jgi:hypothetical protein
MDILMSVKNNLKSVLTKDLLIEYSTLRMKQVEIAKIHGCSQVYVSHLMREYAINKNNCVFSVGKKFGDWYVLGVDDLKPSKDKKLHIKCKCVCGKIHSVCACHLLSGNSKRCRECSGTAKLDLTGDKFGKWTVIKSDDNGNWLCVCDCGRKKNISAGALRFGSSKQCKRCAQWKGFGDISGCYWRSLNREASYRNLSFFVTIEEIWDIYIKQDRKCSISGVDIGFVGNYSKDYSIQTASLDRIGSGYGYIPGNVQWVHRRVNFMKHTLDQQEFINWCIKIADNNSVNKICG